jgi:GTP-binding protein
MIIQTARFLVSNENYLKCPEPVLPEFAIIGRSNVGKSSLINMLLNHQKLAKISARPGKTQLINHFLINDTWYMVDLPGYGFARLGKKQIEKMSLMTRDYLMNRKNLVLVFLLVDARHEPQKIDLELIEFFGENGVPFVLVFTKADKLSRNKVNSNLQKMKNILKKDWIELPLMFMSSAKDGSGREEILNYVDDVLKKVKNSG